MYINVLIINLPINMYGKKLITLNHIISFSVLGHTT